MRKDKTRHAYIFVITYVVPVTSIAQRKRTVMAQRHQKVQLRHDEGEVGREKRA